MSFMMTILCLFYVGSIFGWCMELIFRRIISKEKKWINPGFLIGPYLPLYGFGTCILYLLCHLKSSLNISNRFTGIITLILIMTAALTLLEYVAGIIFIKGMKVKLWDYSSLPGNISGIICPLYSMIWGLLGTTYYFLIHPHILKIVDFFSENLFAIFFSGMFYGFIIIDVVYSLNIVTKIRTFALEKDIVVKLEELKISTTIRAEEQKQKIKFLFPLSSSKSLKSNLRHYYSTVKDKDISIRQLTSEIKDKIKNKK